MIDDHIPVLTGYEILLNAENRVYDFKIFKASDGNEAWLILNNHIENPFDLIFLDINIPLTGKTTSVNGIDLGLKIRNKFKSKILVLTYLENTGKIHSIIESIKPEGFLIKSEITGKSLYQSVDNIINNKNYYSKSIRNIRNSFDVQGNNNLDLCDIKIIELLSKGEKMKDIPKYIPLSLATVERRKKRIKIYFDIENSSDLQLISIAKERGFI